MPAKARRSDYPRSYRFSASDIELIDRLRAHFAGPTGDKCPEVDVLRAGIQALAREADLEKKSKPAQQAKKR